MRPPTCAPKEEQRACSQSIRPCCAMMLAPGATSRRSEFASNDGLHATWTDPLTGAKILAVAGEDPDTMSIAVAPKRLGWWFATDADRSAWPLAIYILTAGFLGMLWNIVLFVIPFTSRPFTA